MTLVPFSFAVALVLAMAGCSSIPMSHRVQTIAPPSMPPTRAAQDIADCEAATPRDSKQRVATYAACMIERGHTATVTVSAWIGLEMPVDVARASADSAPVFADLTSCQDFAREAVGKDTPAKVVRFLVPMAGMAVQTSISREAFQGCMAPKGYRVTW